MIAKSLHTNTLSQIILLIISLTGLCLHILYTDYYIADAEQLPLQRLLFSWTTANTSLTLWVSIALIVANLILIYIITTLNTITNEKIMPLSFFTLAMFLTPVDSNLPIILTISTIFLIAIAFLMTSFTKKNTINRTLISALLFGLASLFTNNFIYFASIVFLITFLIFSYTNTKIWISAIMNVLILMLWYFVAMMMFADNDNIFDMMYLHISTPFDNLFDLIFIGLYALIAIIVFFANMANADALQDFSVKKKLSVQSIIILAALLFFIISKNSAPYLLIFLSMFSICVTDFMFRRTKMVIVNEIIIFILLGISTLILLNDFMELPKELIINHNNR